MTFRGILILMIALCCFASHAQPRRDRVETLRIAYINKHVALSPEEAEKFWPVYNAYQHKLRMARKDLRRIVQSYDEQAGDEAVKDLCRQEQKARRAEQEVHDVYSEKIRQLIGYRKYMRLRLAEEGFRRELIRTLREKEQAD